jgi:DNA-binding transcriptional LysR family regulator
VLDCRRVPGAADLPDLQHPQALVKLMGSGRSETDRDRAEPDGGPQARLDPRRLLVFREVGHRGTMAAAARALGWTQPAVSQHVRRLERDIALPLIARVGRGLELTDAGRVLLRHADAVAAALAAADHTMADLAGLRSGTVRLAAFPSASATLVAAAVSSLAAAHPALDVRLTQVEPPEATALLARGEADVAVVFEYPDQPEPADPVTLTAVPLLDDPLRVVLPTDHPLASQAAVTLLALARERWIAGCPRCRQHLLRRAANAGFTPDIRHSTDDYVVVQSLVAAGTAVAILPSLALAASQRTDIRALPLIDQLPRAVTALLHPDTSTAPAVTATVEHLRRAATEHRKSHPDPSR